MCFVGSFHVPIRVLCFNIRTIDHRIKARVINGISVCADARDYFQVKSHSMLEVFSAFSPLFDATDKGGSRLNLYRARRPNLDGIDAIFTSRFSPAVLRGVVRSRPLPAFPRVSKLNAT